MELYSELEVTKDVALEVGLSENEYEEILKILGRTPTYTEIGIYGVMWSEHCSYKNSIKLLKTLPRSGARLLVEAGQENAGLVDIGDGYAIAFKIESHNHPSAIEPFQGAATGVGGILRDIFTMGARPIAALNSLRFGTLDKARNRFLFRGVVEGIGHYGNCFGVPTVAGEVYFEDCYSDNPLINAMAVGIVHKDKTATAAALGVGNPVMIVGSSTGRDGIHGASLLASREFDEKTDEMRPTVQVGDPFGEKLLLEATLELIEAGVVAGIQDMGAAGISCSTSEMCAKAKTGMEVDLDKVPLRENDMSAYEIMLSESQERMLVVIHKGMEEKAKAICNKWDVPLTTIGEVTKENIINITRHGRLVASLEPSTLALGGGAPQYDRASKQPAYLEETKNFDLSLIEKIPNDEAFTKLLRSPDIASKRWVYEQYDSQVRTNTMSIKGDAAVLRIKEIPGKAIAVTTDCNSRYVYLNPYRGAMIAVAEAARNIVCVGAEPVAITNCLNFGNPYDEEVYWQFRQAVRGMGNACRALGTPVTGGNVSFHNESQHRAVFPTPTIGMLGIIDDSNKIMSAGFKSPGDIIYLIGENRGGLEASEFLKEICGIVAGDAPLFEMDDELELHRVISMLIREEIISSAHDVSEGGLAICLAEKAILSNDKLGADIDLGSEPTTELLFGESQSRVVVSLPSTKENEFKKIQEKIKIPVSRIGVVIADSFKISGCIDSTVEWLISEYESAIPNLMKGNK
ncbi:MAG: phosphoribosylformylglycinamidine synthase [Ignavibacteria bacterium]|nr:phosphoribosylformylglycinamidine synthase [Ignavibacteria bacterium]